MKKITILAIFLLITASISANNKSEKIKTVKKINTELINTKIDSKNNVITFITKYKFIKSNTRKSRMRTVQNLLKNAELYECLSHTVLC